LSESCRLLVISNQKIFRGQIALRNVVAGIELDPLLVTSDRLLNVPRSQVVIKRGDVQAVTQRLAVRRFESLPDVVGGQSVLIEIVVSDRKIGVCQSKLAVAYYNLNRSEEHTSELQSRGHLVCRLL